VAPDFNTPLSYDLQWIYEGLTNYLGFVLAARSGLLSPTGYRDAIAFYAGIQETRTGRSWRSLADVAVSSPLPSDRNDVQSWRRAGWDFYDEGNLLWLEVDVILRTESGGAHSLDDFCRAFFAGPEGLEPVKPYTLDDVEAALSALAHYDWHSFFRKRVFAPTQHAPLGGLVGGGYRLVYREMPNERQAIIHGAKPLYLKFSLGFALQKDGSVIDVIPGSPAARAGIWPGMTIVAIGEQKYTRELLGEAIRAAKSSSDPIVLSVENAGHSRTIRIDYHDGERYPHLERDSSKPDLIAAIIAPRAARTEATPGSTAPR
jgi:predicted metalloprotease with PDZ domain